MINAEAHAAHCRMASIATIIKEKIKREKRKKKTRTPGDDSKKHGFPSLLDKSDSGTLPNPLPFAVSFHVNSGVKCQYCRCRPPPH